MQLKLSSRAIADAGCGIISNLLTATEENTSDSSNVSGAAQEVSRKRIHNAEVASILGGHGACEAIIGALDRCYCYTFIDMVLFY